MRYLQCGIRANLHHLDEKHYDDLSPEKFVFLGKTMHKVVHFLYIYYKKDHTILERLKEVHDDILIDELKQLRSVSEKFQIKW